MIYSDSILIHDVTTKIFDQLLSEGWYRAGNRYFTSAFLQYEGELFNTIWLRIVMQDVEWSSSMKHLQKKNSQFRIQHHPFVIDDEMQLLFKKYKSHAQFVKSPSLADYVFGGRDQSSDQRLHNVKLYDKDLLIGCGIYEIGNDSMEGLVSIYDGNYKKYSLGKFLMMSKIEYGLTLGKKYFYTGYYVPGNQKFDYKLTIASRATEYYDAPTRTWLKYHNYDAYTDELSICLQGSKLIEEVLNKSGVIAKLKIYPFFDYNIHTSFGGYMPVTLPFVVTLNSENYVNDDLLVYMVIYDPRTKLANVLLTTVYGVFKKDLYLSEEDYIGKLIVTLKICCVCPVDELPVKLKELDIRLFENL